MPVAKPPVASKPRPRVPSGGPAPRDAATRIEKDSMGEMAVPSAALYGASTQRAVLNFPVSGRPVPFPVIHAYALLKTACATTNLRLKRLSKPRQQAIADACALIAAGLPEHGGWAKHFPVDVFQTGSGTSTNMNVNEVIANLACLAQGAPIGSSKNPDYIGGKAGRGVHPNDHANMGQSSNDTFPAAIHIAAALAIATRLYPAVARMADDLDAKAAAWDTIVKIGRTHLQDATPIRLGQEFSGYASQLRHAQSRLSFALSALCELPIGGTAVGTGINTHEAFDRMVCEELTRLAAKSATMAPPFAGPAAAHAAAGGPALRAGSSAPLDITFRPAENHFEAQHAKDACVEASGHLKTVAISLSKIANDIRWLGSGPRCGIGELVLPAVQPGSSIMPGKTNPVIAESLIMVCCQVVGNDAAISLGGFGGVGSLLDLNVAMPLIADNLLQSIHLLAAACDMFTNNLLAGLQPDRERCQSLIEGSLAMCTSLVPVIGYDKSAALAKEAFKQGKTVRQLAYESVVGEKDLAGKPIAKTDIDAALDPWSMTLPGGEGSAGG